MSFGKPFQKGMPKLGGRVKGSRNKISESFLHDLAQEWEVSGPACLKVMAKEDPSGFVKVTAALLPKEFSIEDNRLAELDDDQLEMLIAELRAKLRTAIVDRTGDGEKPTSH